MTEADHPAQLIRRQVEALVEECVQDFRVTIVNGPRQAGKTTLLRQLHAKLGGTFVTFDDADQRAAARDDPAGYLQAGSRPLFIDEVQRAGDEFVVAIKAAVDRDRRPGMFVLSGSTRFLTVPTLSESLAGRAALIELWPFSVAERVGAAPDFLNRVFNEPDALLHESPAALTRHEYLRLACIGGFPEVVARRSTRSRAIWFRSYLTTVTQREVLDIARVRNIELLPRMFRLLAALTAQELNAAALARNLGIDDETVRSYLPLLETVFLLHRLPAWSRNLTARVKSFPGPRRPGGGLCAGDAGRSSDWRGDKDRRDRTGRGFPASHDTARPNWRSLHGRCGVFHRGASVTFRGSAHRIAHLVIVGRCGAAIDALRCQGWAAHSPAVR